MDQPVRPPLALAWDDLCTRCDPERFSFESTGELEPLSERVGQQRAVAALQFGVGIRHEGYNIYAMGRAGAGKYTAVRAVLEQRAAKEPVPQDLCYVHDFAQPNRPRALRLPAGKGNQLRKDLEQLVDDLQIAIPGALESDEFRARKESLEEELKNQQESAFGELKARAEASSVALVHTPLGFALAPVKNGEVLEPDDFAKLPEDERAHFEHDMAALSQDLRALLEKLPRWEQEVRRKLKTIIREMLMAAVGHLLDDAKAKYADLPAIVSHLAAIQQDVLENADEFIKREEPTAVAIFDHGDRFRRYQVNVLVDHTQTKGAPVVFEDHPTYENLVGRHEHVAQFGALVTDFNHIKPGALHRASGGYLLLDVHNLLVAPYAWDGLKRALFAKQVRIESLSMALGFASTVSLEPEPVPTDVKVVLMGERRLFYLLDALDPDFRALFKVAVDFEDEVDRTPDNDVLYARLVATIVRDEKLRPFDRGGVARVIEQSARMADDSEKLTAHMGSLVDLAREADYWAAQRGGERVTRPDVERAIETQRERAGRMRERSLEAIERGTLLIETTGERVGQVNGLSVLELGGFTFGRPTRITARVRLGRGEVVDIEREVELGGPIHSKGVLILSAFLGARYALKVPLSLSATIAFEQSYGMVEGDSASAAELYSLLSALSEIPIRQSIAVTGSVNQHGQVQPIGGVNEKIEGFFDACRATGLTGDQGVIIPHANVKHLMLRDDVVAAVREERFAIWQVTTVDEGLALLTGSPAGERDALGQFPAESVNGKVEARLTALAQLRQSFGANDGGHPHGADHALKKWG
ncbi:MAG TPA: AAA family ATPase [Polyangiaceae bacterium]|nr:AAA family ATPase [Polyangiaceae bacterium]